MSLGFPEIKANVLAAVNSPTDKLQRLGFVTCFFQALAQTGLLDRFSLLAFPFGQAPVPIGLSDEQNLGSLIGLLQQGDPSLMSCLEASKGPRLRFRCENPLFFRSDRCPFRGRRPVMTLVDFFHATGCNSACKDRVARGPGMALLKIA